MTNPRSRVLQIDVTRSVKGVQAAGVSVARVEIDHATGKVIVFTMATDDSGPNPCDRLLK